MEVEEAAGEFAFGADFDSDQASFVELDLADLELGRRGVVAACVAHGGGEFLVADFDVVAVGAVAGGTVEGGDLVAAGFFHLDGPDGDVAGFDPVGEAGAGILFFDEERLAEDGGGYGGEREGAGGGVGEEGRGGGGFAGAVEVEPPFLGGDGGDDGGGGGGVGGAEEEAFAFFQAELAAFGQEIGDEGGGLAGEAFDLDPLGAAGAAGGADEEGALGAELVEGGVGPGGGHGGEDADLAAPALEEHLVDGAGAGERGLDDGAGFEIHGVGLGVAVEELVEEFGGVVAAAHLGFEGGGPGVGIALEGAFEADPVVEGFFDEGAVFRLVPVHEVEGVDHEEVGVVAVGHGEGDVAADHEAGGGIDGVGGELGLDFAPAGGEGVVGAEEVVGGEEGLEAPAEEGEVVVRVGGLGVVFGGDVFFEVERAIGAGLELVHHVVDRAAEEGEEVAEVALVHGVAVLEPVAVQGPGEAAELDIPAVALEVVAAGAGDEGGVGAEVVRGVVDQV